MAFEEYSEMKAPKTSRIYLHPVYSSRLISMYPDFKITNLELNQDKWHYKQKGSAFIILGNDMEQLDYRSVVFDEVKNGYPVYTVHVSDKNGANISMTSFCSSDENPTVFSHISVKNETNITINGQIGILPRTSDNDIYLTGLFDTGYEPYMPNVKRMYMLPCEWKPHGISYASDGYASICLKNYDSFDIRWISYEEQPHHFKASKCYAAQYSLSAGEEISMDIIFSTEKASDACELSYDFSKEMDKTKIYWDNILSKIKVKPNTKAPRLQNMYLQMVTQSLQMLAKYKDNNGNTDKYIFPRQGDVGRFIWAWEAVYYLTALDRIGLCEYTYPAYKMLLEKWQITDPINPDFGKIANPNVNWANTNGSVIWGAAMHLLYSQNRKEYIEFKPYLDRAVNWIEYQRSLSAKNPDNFPGLFPSAKASDWGEVGQHYTYTDSVNVMSYRELAKAYAMFCDPDTDRMQSLYNDYFSILQNILVSLELGHEDETEYMPTHILGKNFEEVRMHCYYCDGVPYLVMCGIMDPKTKLFEQMEAFYRRHGLFDHDLPGRMTNADIGMSGLYGDIYYTNVAEIIWIYSWLARGERDKAENFINSILKYNVTKEYATSERYSPLDEFYAPWQPNGSACGRVISLLLDFYGERYI